MARRSGLQAEVLASLALVMAAATAVVAVILVAHQERMLREVLGRALAAEARALRGAVPFLIPGTEWWLIGPEGSARALGAGAGSLDPATRQLAQRARASGASLFAPGAASDSIRFAMPLGPTAGVVAARLPRAASRRLRTAPRQLAAAVLLADTLVFTAFGAYLLRRRVVLPLRRLRDAAEAIAEGATGARVPVEGARETADVAAAFNAMSDALEGRTRALEKAVADLRGANRELRETRVGLDRAERLAAVGRLAAGVAHEVGNPMGAILAFLDLARRDPQLSPETRNHLERAERQGERVRTILRQLLDFSRPARGDPAPLDLITLAEETIALVGAQRRYAGVVFGVRREGDPPRAWADPGAVSQILVNLVLNAADAVRGRPEARVELCVRGSSLEVREGEGRAAEQRRRRFDAVECVVSDNGEGIPSEDRERVFDPFYTSKAPGEGTGLGLANASRLAEEGSGALELLDLEPGRGATFVLRLPAAAGTRGVGALGSRAR